MPVGQRHSEHLLGKSAFPRQSNKDRQQCPRLLDVVLDKDRLANPAQLSHQTHSRQAQEEKELAPHLTVNTVPAQDGSLVHYPAYCHKVSPTWFEWVKLTARDIHTKLHIQDGYQHSWLAEYRYRRDAPQLMFYLNHPIQFVQIVGVVISFDEYFEHFWLFTIDDSSGLTVDVVCRKPAKVKENPHNSGGASSDTRGSALDDDQKDIMRLSALVACSVEIGAVLQVKGVLTLFQRNKPVYGFDSLRQQTTPDEPPVRQLSLQRLARVHDTNQEIKIIAARTQFHNQVLSKPWVLSSREKQKLQREALGESEHDKKRARKHSEKLQKLVQQEKEDEEAIREDYLKEEKMREDCAELARQAGLRFAKDLDTRSKGLIKNGNQQEQSQSIPNRRQGQSASPTNLDKRRQKKRKIRSLNVGSQQLVDPHDTTNDSFAALDDEKSALLKAAFDFPAYAPVKQSKQ